MRTVPINYLEECFDVDFDTGTLVWKIRPLHHFASASMHRSWNARYGGTIAGGLMANGYYNVVANKTRVYCHRVVMALYNKEWPNGNIDHIDGNRANNSISNLRIATQQQNCKNVAARAGTASGYKGVTKKRDRWQARVAGKSVGVFATPVEAAIAYDAHAYALWGEFSRPNFRAAVQLIKEGER